MDDDAIRVLVKGLSRSHASGGAVVERAAIMAAGADSAAVLAWIDAHDGQPEALPTPVAPRGLHGARRDRGGASGPPVPRRFVLPPGALS